MSAKKHVGIVMQIGQVMALGDEDYEKQKVRATEMQDGDIAEALIAAFGDGK